MQRALALAKRATGNVSPNPLVGAVIVKNNSIIGEGWHQRAGEPHAEVNAIANCSEDPRGATIYVTLEPCSHFGKTPPCTQAIEQAGIVQVVYATGDPNATAAGGEQVLVEKGIETLAGICEEEARHVNRFFFHHIAHGTPYVVAKFASSLDGKTATRTGNSQWITGNAAREKSHTLRQACDAILVGAQTVIDDDPALTVRLDQSRHEYEQLNHPLRIVLDAAGRIPPNAALFNDQHRTLVVCTDTTPNEYRDSLKTLGVDSIDVATEPDSTRIFLPKLLTALGEKNIQSLMVEGGQNVLGSFIDHKLVNEVWAFLAPMLIGGNDALPSIGGLGINKLQDAIRLTNLSLEQLDADLLIRGRTDHTATVH